MGIWNHTPKTCMSKNSPFLATCYSRSSQWTCQIEIRKVSELSKFELGKFMRFPNLDLESYAMRVTCIIILVISQAVHNVLHISYHVVHIILSYAMRPWKPGLDIRNSQNEGSTYGTSTRETSSTNIESVSFINTYFIFIFSYTSAATSHS